IHIDALDMKEIFHLLTLSFRKIIAGDYSNEASEKKKIFLESQSEELLVVDYMNELIYLFDVYAFMPVSGRFDVYNNRVDALLDGFIIKKEYVIRLLKAATFHNLVMKKEDKRIHLEMIIDV
ncbi:MAG: archease, partial [Elusimicrobiales bacterium]